MKQEDKELLLKDLCARLPYEVILVAPSRRTSFPTDGNTAAELCVEQGWKPYLRPLSSMTEEEYVHFMSICGMNLRSYEIQEMMSENFSHPNKITIVNTLGGYSHNIDWLNKNMFDYRGLIEKGLALEAPDDMYEINKK
jgi:hypothetical protein